MRNFMVVLACSGLLLAGCGEKAEQLKKQIDAAQQLAGKGEEMEKSMNEAEEIYNERVAKGDTVVIPYKDLQAYLPQSIGGYRPEGEPSGSQQSMPGFSISQAEQNWVGESNEAARINVKIVDYGGTKGAYSMSPLSLSMMISSEDDHQRTGPLKLDVPTTAGMSTFKKDNKSATVIVGTRYRYLITLQADGGEDDQTGMLAALATDIAKKFEGK